MMMKDKTDIQVMPSATPSTEDIEKWNALARDEQLRRLRAALTHPDCAVPASETMSDILVEARARAKSNRG